uniref:snRNA-activating protein complex subunit 2 n=1 Tax=Myripristis murdjan TaxID=586833 RepID=A0A667XRR7_9TELE
MKPPSRRRAKPARLEVEEEDSAQDCPGEVPLAPWSRIEQHGALVVLRRLDPSAGDIDYDALKKRLPRRSISQIRSMVEALKDKVIKSASSQLISQRNAEKRFQKPIELWTEMALIMAGTLEKPISAAFSQMLMVSSTEPCSLRNSDPPHSHTPATDQQTPGLRFVPMRPMPSRPAPGGISHIILKTPAKTMSPARALPAPCQDVRVRTATLSQAQRQSLAPAPGTSSDAISASQTVATSHQTGTATTAEAAAASPLRPATAAASVQVLDSTRQPQPLRLAPASKAGAFVRAMAVSTSVPQASPQPAEPLKVVGELAAATPQPQPQPQPKPHTAGVGTSPAEIPTVCSSVGTDGPQPQNTEATSTVSSHTLDPTGASPRPPPQQHSNAVSSATAFNSPLSSVADPSSPSASTDPSDPPRVDAAGSQRTSKHAGGDGPRRFGVKCIVDFEKIYRYLSSIHMKDEECALTPMESAIVLDLLMSLPEELPKLDCNNLQRHMIQVYSGLSAPANSEKARGMFDFGPEKGQNDPDQSNRTPSHHRDSRQTERGSGPNPDQDKDGMDTTSQDGDSNVAMDSVTGERVQPCDGQAESRSSESSDALLQPGVLEW